MKRLYPVVVLAAFGLGLLGCEKKPAELTTSPVVTPLQAPLTPRAEEPRSEPAAERQAEAEPPLPTAKTEELAVEKAAEMDEERQATYRAAAMLKGLGDSAVAGTVNFEVAKDDDSVKVEVKLSGLSPGEHGFHIHVKGDCSAADGSSAGGHFNPTDAEHGAPDADARHVGDLGNIKADDDGTVDTTLTLRGALLGSEPTSPTDRSIIGRAIIVHSGPDDLKSQPAGGSGTPVACGVITKVEF
jgi:Cu-Zn family superoxide dismutase